MYQTWGAGNYLGFYDIPFKAFDISDPQNPRQLNVFLRDRNDNSLWDLHTDPYDMTRVAPWNDIITIDTQYNYVFIMATDYDPGLFMEVAHALSSQGRTPAELWKFLESMAPFEKSWYGSMQLGATKI